MYKPHHEQAGPIGEPVFHMSDIITMLNMLGRDVQKTFPDINFGGCGVFAAEIANSIETRLNLPVRVRTAWGHEDQHDVTIDTARNLLCSRSAHTNHDASAEDWKHLGVHFWHVITEFEYEGKTYHFDTAGVAKQARYTTMFGYAIVHGHLTVKEAQSIAAHSSGWNDDFDRRQIPALRAKINSYFDMVKC